jgi:hypothetical protein
MRFLGYLLLCIGFVSLPLLHDVDMHAAKGFAMARAFPADSATKTSFTLREVLDITERALDEMEKLFPRRISSDVVMLAGALLLDLANRRRRKAKDAA